MAERRGGPVAAAAQGRTPEPGQAVGSPQSGGRSTPDGSQTTSLLRRRKSMFLRKHWKLHVNIHGSARDVCRCVARVFLCPSWHAAITWHRHHRHPAVGHPLAKISGKTYSHKSICSLRKYGQST